MSNARHCQCHERCDGSESCECPGVEPADLEAMLIHINALPGEHWKGDDAFAAGVRHGVTLARSVVCGAIGSAKKPPACCIAHARRILLDALHDDYLSALAARMKGKG